MGKAGGDGRRGATNGPGLWSALRAPYHRTSDSPNCRHSERNARNIGRLERAVISAFYQELNRLMLIGYLSNTPARAGPVRSGHSVRYTHVE